MPPSRCPWPWRPPARPRRREAEDRHGVGAPCHPRDRAGGARRGGGLVDVCANGSVELINDFAPGELKTLEVAPGTYTLTVHAGAAAGCASTPLLSAAATVVAGHDYTVTANLSAPPVVGPVLNVFVNNKAPVTKYASKATLNTGRVTVRHIAVAPAVDVFVNGNVAISGLTNPNQAQAKLGRGTYQVAAGLAGAGTAGIALGPIPLPVKAG